MNGQQIDSVVYKNTVSGCMPFLDYSKTTIPSSKSTGGSGVYIYYNRYLKNNWGLSIGYSKGTSNFVTDNISASRIEIDSNITTSSALVNSGITLEYLAFPVDFFYFIPLYQRFAMTPHIGLSWTRQMALFHQKGSAYRFVHDPVTDTASSYNVGRQIETEKFWKLEAVVGLDLDYFLSPEISLGLNCRYFKGLKSQSKLTPIFSSSPPNQYGYLNSLNPYVETEVLEKLLNNFNANRFQIGLTVKYNF